MLFDNTHPEQSLHAVLDHLGSTVGTTMNANAAESVSHSLAEVDPETQLPLKDAITEYTKDSFTCYNEENIEDTAEMEQQELPDQESDSDSVTEPVSSAGAAQRKVSSTQLLPPIDPGNGKWGVVVIKNIINLCAKHKIDQEKWPGCDVLARNRVISGMAGDFQWSSNELPWFWSSVQILWDLVLGAKPRGEKNTIGHWVSRKTKIVGILPLRLFSGMQRETARTYGEADSSFVLWVATKGLFNRSEAKRRAYSSNVPDDYDMSKKLLLLEVHSEGSPDNCLAFLKRSNKFEWLTKVPDTYRRESIKEWATL